MNNNRLFKCVAFRTALKSYMKQLTTEQVASIIQTGGKDFLNTMIVMAEHDVNDLVGNQNERFGIVIPEGMVHNYIDRWFNDLTNYVGENIFKDDRYRINFVLPSSLRSRKAATWMLNEFINKNRPLMNPAFRYALCTYIKQLTTEKIASLIHTAKVSFLNTMFVMTQDDINDHAKNRYEWFGIVIPDDLLQQYIEKYFNGLTNEFWLVDNIHTNRALKI
ncbi:unnamed protein product [Mytilus edulis]|uniref:Uncharacterized protein n=1 Tax=Mytilus edulis TaxID=6550 RepID=A0A8S3SWP4_MYTED|nr:unnamed protein product [Mytilus edulis]